MGMAQQRPWVLGKAFNLSYHHDLGFLQAFYKGWGVKGFSLNYHNKETIVFTLDPYYDNLKYNP